ncbi:hypothetical protein BDR07DRAFT_1496317 [Suillus spraguei]|nr:hypothetical protein BDR07DRAFT_1496317 [Suillus spraguei]
MTKAPTQVRKVKEPRKRGRPSKKQSQLPSGTQVEDPSSQEVVSKTKPRPRPIPLKKPGTSSAATVPGGSSSAPEVGAAVAASKSIDFDKNTAAALLLGLAQPVGDSEVPDPVGEYNVEDEDFFQNLKESGASHGLDDEHSQLGDEEAPLLHSEINLSFEATETLDTELEILFVQADGLING